MATVRQGRWTLVDGAMACFALGLLLIAVNSAGHVDEFSTGGLLAYLVLPGLTALGVLASLRATRLIKAKILLGLVATGFAILMGSLYLEVQTARIDREHRAHPSRFRARAFARRGLAFDAREVTEVVADLRRQGVSAVPFFAPSSLRDVKGIARVPLGGIASALTVYCNEAGTYVTFQSDEHGFRNPAGSHGSAADVVILGDSYGMGYCVQESDSIAGTIRASVPRTVNLSASGNGPLYELAALREFGARLRPRFVIWVYYDGNDLWNLENETRNAVLARYFDASFRQGLIEAQADVDAQIAEAVAKPPAPPNTPFARVLSNSIRFTNVRALLSPWLTAPRVNPLVPLLEKVLVATQEAVATWNGKLVFVFLPELQAVRNPGEAHATFRHGEVAALVHRLGLPFVDMVERFAQSSVPPQDPRFPPDSHYDANGYRLTAAAVLEQLR
jgi:hypothetical protein